MAKTILDHKKNTSKFLADRNQSQQKLISKPVRELFRQTLLKAIKK